MEAPVLRALTVRQPWAWALIYGGKTTENRSSLWRHRGPLLVHAGMALSHAGMADPAVRAAFADWRAAHGGAEPVLDRGVFLGLVTLTDAHWETGGCCAPWGMRGQVHLSVADPVALPEPIPATGRLGLWDPPSAVVDRVHGWFPDRF